MQEREQSGFEFKLQDKEEAVCVDRRREVGESGRR